MKIFRWFNAQTSLYGLAPGFVTDGPNHDYTANTNLTPPYNQPDQKSYLDFNSDFPDNSWEITEDLVNLISNIEKGRVDVLSVNGAVLKSEAINNTSFEMDLSTLSKGVCFVKIQDRNGNQLVEKLVKY